MPTVSVQVTRFWSPPSEAMPGDEDGFLLDLGESAKHWRQLRTTDQLLDGARCCVLLGEPGIGKTTAVARLAKLRPGFLRFELGSSQSAAEIRDQVFRSPAVLEWLGSDTGATLALDALDECRLAEPAVANVILDEVSRLPVARLSLILVCRTAVWSSGFQDLQARLEQTMNAEVRTVEMLPLRRKDAEAIVDFRGLPGRTFVADGTKRGLGPLLTRPLTLNMMVDGQLAGAEPPRTRSEAYAGATERLLAENSAVRRDGRKRGVVSAERRMEIAQRIAFVLTFGPRQDIELTADGLVPTSFKWLVSAATAMLGTPASELLEEVLDTALFAGVGPSRIAFVHQSFRDYLTARHLCAAVPRDSVRALLLGSGTRVPAQFIHVAAWIASLDRSLRDEMLANDHEALLGADPATLDEDARRALLSATLDAFVDGTRVIVRNATRRVWGRFSYQGIDDDLRHYLDAASSSARFVALRIATQCKCEALGEEAVGIALQDDDLGVREAAVDLIEVVGTRDQRRRLQPLVGPTPDDPDEEIRGAVLNILWPNDISAEQLFSVLTMPARSSLHGAYSQFLGAFAEKLVQPDVPFAVAWLSEHGVHNRVRNDGIASVIGRILDVGTDDHCVRLLEVLVPAIRSYLTHAIAEALENAPFRAERFFRLAFAHVQNVDIRSTVIEQLAAAEHFDTLLAGLAQEADPAARAWWFALARSAGGKSEDRDNRASRLMTAAWPHDDLRSSLDLYIELDSRLGKILQGHARVASQREAENSRKHDAFRESALAQLRAGQVLAGWPAILAAGEAWVEDLRSTDLWTGLSEGDRAMVVRAALQYLVVGRVSMNERRKSAATNMDLTVTAAATRLVVSDGAMRPALARMWAELLPAALSESAARSRDLARPSIAAALEDDESAVVAALLQDARRATRTSYGWGAVRLLSGLWRASMSEVILEAALAEHWAPCVVEDLVELVARSDRPRADRTLSSLGAEAPTSWWHAVTFAMCAGTLLTLSPAATWSTIERLLPIAPEVVVNAMLHAARVSTHRHSYGKDVPERGCAALYELLRARFPVETDPQLRGDVTWRHSIAEVRNAFFQALYENGSEQAVAEIEELRRRYPSSAMDAAFEIVRRRRDDAAVARPSLQVLRSLAFDSAEDHQAMPTDQVFVSYSHDSDAHKRRVLELVQRLRTLGASATCDQFEPFPTKGFPRWQREQIEVARFVLVVCTKTYKERAEGHVPPGRGAGASAEGLQVDQELYEANGRNEKFLPVLFDGDDEDERPGFLRPYRFFRWPSQQDDLWGVLIGRPPVVPVPVATPAKLAPREG